MVFSVYQFLIFLHVYKLYPNFTPSMNQIFIPEFLFLKDICILNNK